MFLLTAIKIVNKWVLLSAYLNPVCPKNYFELASISKNQNKGNTEISIFPPGQLQKEASFERASISPPESPLVGRRHSDVSPSRINANYANNTANANLMDGNLGVPSRKDGSVSPRFSASDRRR